VVLAGSKWPGRLRKRLTRSKWSFERGKRLKETRSLWPPQRGLGSLEPNLDKNKSSCSSALFLGWFVFPSPGLYLSPNANLGLNCVLKFINFIFRLSTPSMWLSFPRRGFYEWWLQAYFLLEINVSFTHDLKALCTPYFFHRVFEKIISWKTADRWSNRLGLIKGECYNILWPIQGARRLHPQETHRRIHPQETHRLRMTPVICI
jgi:hypothetical protein